MKLFSICEADASIDASIDDGPVKQEISDIDDINFDIEKQVSDKLDQDELDQDELDQDELDKANELRDDAKEEIKMQHKEITTPILNQLDTNFDELDQDLQHGENQSQRTYNSISNLDKQLSGVRNLIKNLEDSLL